MRNEQFRMMMNKQMQPVDMSSETSKIFNIDKNSEPVY